MSSVNEVLQTHAPCSSKMTVRIFTEQAEEVDDDGNPIPAQSYVLLEGDRNALKFLAELIVAQVESDYGCTLDIHPRGPGSIHFSNNSTVGIFVHKLPCDLHPSNVVR